MLFRSTHGSSSLVSTTLCIFCHGVLIECRCVPVSGQSHRAPDFFPLCCCPCRIRSLVGLGVPDTYQPPRLHTPTLRTRSPSSETRSSRTRSPSLAHGFRLDQLAMVRPIRRRSPAHHRPSRKRKAPLKMADGERSQVVFVYASSANPSYAEARARAACTHPAAMAFCAKTPSVLRPTARRTIE